MVDSSIKVTGVYRERPHRQAVILSLSFSLSFCRQCKQVHISRPRNQHNCCLSESWTDLKTDSFRKECVWLGGKMRTNKLCQHSVCSLKSLSLLAFQFISVATGLCLPSTAGWLIASLFISYILCLTTNRFLSFLSFTFSSLLFNQACIQPPRHFHPHYSPPQPRRPGRQASRLGAQMVLWRVSQLWVSEPAGRQDGPSVADMAEASPGTCL